MVTKRPSCRCGSMPVWSVDATRNPNDGDRSAEHAVAADRFARKIVRFLMSAFAARSRQLNGNPFGVQGTSLASLFDVYGGESRFPNARRAGSVVQKPVVQGVVRKPVVLIARYAGRGTVARCADCSFWAA